MLRTSKIAGLTLLLSLLASAASAQDWAVKMFNSTTHDFGTVAKGSLAEYRFVIKNIYEEDAHIQSVTSSCGCTTPVITKNDLKTFESGEIVAVLNTKTFTGHKSATLKVVFDKPFHAEVNLNITAFIRSDVVTQPGIIDFGSVDQGTASEQKLHVAYAGRDDWKLLDVKTADPWYEVEMKETARGGGRVSYDLLVRLRGDAPAGYLHDQLILVTNDAKAREIPVDLQGRVASEITISPEKLFLGVVNPGQQVKKNLVVRGKRPFKITDIECPECFQIQHSADAKTVHLIPVLFTAGDAEGQIAQQISIKTDQSGAASAITAFAEVVKANSPTTPTPAAEPEPIVRKKTGAFEEVTP